MARKRVLGAHEVEVPLVMLDKALDAVAPVMRQARKADRPNLETVRLTTTREGMVVESTDGHMAARVIMPWDTELRPVLDMGAFEPPSDRSVVMTADCVWMIRQNRKRRRTSPAMDRWLSVRLHMKRGVLQVLHMGRVMETTRGNLAASMVTDEFPPLERVMEIERREEMAYDARQDRLFGISPTLMTTAMRCAAVMGVGCVQVYPPTTHGESSWVVVGKDAAGTARIEIVVMGMRR
jgi:hypothetical protein